MAQLFDMIFARCQTYMISQTKEESGRGKSRPKIKVAWEEQVKEPAHRDQHAHDALTNAGYLSE